MSWNFKWLVAVSSLLLLSSGCVRETIQPEYRPRVSTSQNSDGVVTLSWPSKVGYNYTLLVMNEKTRAWHKLKGTAVYRGTGDTIQVKDQRNPRQQLPWYSVRAEKR